MPVATSGYSGYNSLFPPPRCRIFRHLPHKKFRTDPMKTLAKVVLATAVAALSLPAFAQDTIGTLTVNSGTVMTSNGGEFASATTGAGIESGERLMVSEGGSATVNFTNGAVVNYTAPGVYTVTLPAAASPVAATATSPAVSAGIILGAAVLGAAAIDQMGDDTPPDHPISR
jgi:hypothetical protein